MLGSQRQPCMHEGKDVVAQCVIKPFHALVLSILLAKSGALLSQLGVVSQAGTRQGLTEERKLWMDVQHLHSVARNVVTVCIRAKVHACPVGECQQGYRQHHGCLP